MFRFLYLILFGICVSSCAKIDDSMKLFFPKEVKNLQAAQTEFSAFWWNFAVIESKNGKPNFEKAEKLCKDLKLEIGRSLRMLICGENISSGLPLLIQWGQDIVFREKFDPSEAQNYRSRINETLVQLSFASQKELLPLFRSDPFQSWKSFLQISNRPEFSNLVRQNGFMLSLKTQDIIIPIQFSLRPQMSTTEKVMSLIQSDTDYHLIGAHASSYLNEKQVRADMQLVSIISGIIFFLFILLLFLKSRMVAILVFIPTIISVWLAAALTSWIYGSVHGLTLAFGSGIAGLAMDYGLHGAFGSNHQQTWKSNFIGLITTLCGIGILAFSGIPLIQQMMVFSLLGLGIGFLIFYLISRYLSDFFKMQSLPVKFPVWRYSPIILIIVVAVGFFGFSKLQMSMDLRKLSFMSKSDENIAKLIFSSEDPKIEKETILLISPNQKDLISNYEEKNWAVKNRIHYEGLGNYLLPQAQQMLNFKSWNQEGCSFLKKKMSDQQKKFFDPFLDSTCMLNTEVNLLDRMYVNHLVHEDQNLTIFSTENKNQTQQVLEKYPQATSLAQALKDFSNALSKDLAWMIPISIVLTLLVLCVYYKNAFNVFTAILPFLIGLSSYFLVAIILDLEVNLVSVLGLVMVFGFSVDYGVFSTDVHRHSGDLIELKSVYSALTFAAITNSLGFFPMLFAKHPVLHNLGTALFYGTVGTYVGTIWAVYVLYSKKSHNKKFWYF